MDVYSNYDTLQCNETKGKDYRIVICNRKISSTVVIAPHGGGIEPGTSEIAIGIASNDLSLVSFEGTKSKNNCYLHITSTNFDEPECLQHVQAAQNVIAIHGERSQTKTVYIGGADTELALSIQDSLKACGFQVSRHTNPNLQGTSPQNICNRGMRGMGVQLEIAAGLRKTFFQSSNLVDRRNPTENLYNFSNGVRDGLNDLLKI